MKLPRRWMVLGLSLGFCLFVQFSNLLAAGFQINVSATPTNLHLAATTVPAGRLLWMKGDRADSITNVAQIETVPAVQHNLQLPAAASSQFFRAVQFDTNVERTPFACSAGHALAILTNGSIACWGDNTLGQFGNNLPRIGGGLPIVASNACWIVYRLQNPSAGPLPQSTDTDWVSVAAGTGYCLALKSNATLWAWGDNSGAGLGNPTIAGFCAFPVPVGTNAAWRSVFAYDSSSFAIRTDGTLWAWGDNSNSVLGLGAGFASSSVVTAPVQVGTASNWVTVFTLPRNYSVGIQSDGSLWAWGLTTLPSYVRAGYAQTNLTTPVTTSPSPVNIPGPWISTGIHPTTGRGIFLRADGTLWATTTHAADYSNWQVYENYFQNQFTNSSSIYNQLIGFGVTPADVLAYITGQFYVIYPQLQGFNFDYNAFLQFTSDAQYLQPYASRSNWVMLASGIALNQDGTIWTLGEGPTRSAASPRDGDWQRVNSDTDWRYVGPGYAAAKAGGQLWGWQTASFPDLTQNPNADMVLTPGTNQWISAKMTQSHAVAMDTHSNLWVWGSNESGQLGVGDNEPRLTPTPLPLAGPWLDYAVAVPAGAATFAIRQDGTLWAWGDYNFTGTNVTSPVQLNPERPWRSVFAHNAPFDAAQIFLVAQDGTLWACGNNYGQGLGINNSNTIVNVPGQVPGSNWLSVAPGVDFAIATKTDGTLWGWGNSSVDMGLGYGTNLVYTNPVIVSSNLWSNIAADASDGFAIRSDGTLWSWGQFDSHCELAQPSNQGLQFTQCWTCVSGPCNVTENYFVQPYGTNIVIAPLQVGSDNHWKSAKFAEYGEYTLALKQDGSMWVWGLSPFPSVTNTLVYLTPPSHPYPGVPYPEYTGVLPMPYRVGTNLWTFMDPSGAAVTTSGQLYLWNNRAVNGQTFLTPAWLPAPIRSNIVCRLPPAP